MSTITRRHLITSGLALGAGAALPFDAQAATRVVRRIDRTRLVANCGPSASTESKAAYKAERAHWAEESYRIRVTNRWFDEVSFAIIGWRPGLEARMMLESGETKRMSHVQGGERLALAFDTWTFAILDAVVIQLDSPADFKITDTGLIDIA